MYGLSLEPEYRGVLDNACFLSYGGRVGGQNRDGQGEWACSPNPGSNASLPDCAHRHDRGLSKCTTNNVANVPRSPAKKLKHK